MTLGDTLLQKLADWRPAGEGRHTLAATDQATGWHVAVTADRHSDLGCAVWELDARRSVLSADVRPWAERVAAGVSGLLEKLTLIEVDAARNEALLRSAEPARRGDNVFYYEVRLRDRSRACVRRYRADHDGGRREQVSFTLTHEGLAKLADDVLAET
jgi:hypothetical protein